MSPRFLPEWVKQEAIILAWPDANTDWAPWLDSVERVYVDLIGKINQVGCAVVLLAREPSVARAQSLLAQASSVVILTADYNDTWVRDYGFLTLTGNQPVEFTFNGWGNKFNAEKDNKVNQQLFSAYLNKPIRVIDIVCEGGALEIDQQGHLLSTELCLTNPQRNGDMALAEYQRTFKQALGASKVSIYQHGHLEGDDTDGHIDTLVRFTPTEGIVVQSAYNRPDDSHFEGLKALVREVALDRPDLTLFELPLPHIVNQDGERLPASYANYLINNQQVLCPIYQQPEDEEALAVLAQAYPGHEIVGVNCLPLVQQFGSLHCISMQVPEGTFNQALTQHFARGVITL